MGGDPLTMWQTALSGLISGGATAATTFAAVFRDIKKRLATLEDRVGADGRGTATDPKTGLFQVVYDLDRTTQRILKTMSGWEDEPPDWAMRIFKKAQRASSASLDAHEIEDRVEQRLRLFAKSLERLNDDLDRRERRLEEELERSSPDLDTYITRQVYEEDMAKRAEEIRRLNRSLTAVNGMLRGILEDLGHIDPNKR